tara:strand:- start:1554 stop:1811 length:258 start_codon:yes stop_codon:yes gene_type:complete
MKTVIHVNQHIIKSNSKRNEREPVLTCKTYKSNTYAHNVIIYGQDGEESARVIYSPDKPLSCGAKVWIETSNKIKTIPTLINKKL